MRTEARPTSRSCACTASLCVQYRKISYAGKDDALEEGMLAGGLPYRAVGSGSPLVYFPPFAPYHTPTTGVSRTIEVYILRRFAAGGFRVVAINRRPGLAPSTTMDDLAAQYAQAINQRFAEPINIVGFSTGGAIALHVAAEYPQLVRRLVLASAAHHLSAVAWDTCRRAAERAQAGDVRGFQAAMAPTASRSRWGQWAAAVFGWLFAPLTVGRGWDASDAVITLRADMGIDVEARLGAIRAPPLIISGERDPSYPPAITADLATRIPNACRVVYPCTGHGVILNKRFVPDLAAFLT